MGKIQEIIDSKQAPGMIVDFDSHFKPEDSPTCDRALLDLSISDQEYEEMLEYHIDKHPENEIVDEFDMHDHLRDERITGTKDTTKDWKGIEEKFFKEKEKKDQCQTK